MIQRISTPRRDPGFTLIERLVVIAIIAILAAMLLPAILAASKEEQNARPVNLHQICIGIATYGTDNGDLMPPLKWRDGNPHNSLTRCSVTLPPMWPLRLSIRTAGPIKGTRHNGYEEFGCGQELLLSEQSKRQQSAFLNSTTLKVPWPLGGDPTASNPAYVRSGYSYYPQSRTSKMTSTALGQRDVPYWPDYTASPPAI